jgi:hypothetical protein
MTTVDDVLAGRAPRVTYNDQSHVYMVDNRRQKSVTAVAKILNDNFTLEGWAKRQVAIGFALNQTLVEDVAAHIDDRERVDATIERAMQVAGADDKARRGTQAHRATENIDLGVVLVTDQQRADAARWQATLAAHGITPDPRFVERIVWFPEHDVMGRTDRWAWLGDELTNCDIKTSYNAIKYPHSTAVQLALQTHAPLFAAETHFEGNLEVVDRWELTPPNLRRDISFVVHLPTDGAQGNLYRFDIDEQVVMAMRASLYGRLWQAGEPRTQFVSPPLRPAAPAAPQASEIEAVYPPEHDLWGNVVDLLAHRQQVLLERIMGFADVDRNALRETWQASSLPSIGTPMTAAELEVAEQLADAHDPFMVVVPPAVPDEPVVVATVTVPSWPIDEGDVPSTMDVVKSSREWDSLAPEHTTAISALQVDAQTHGVGFHLHGHASMRRLMLADTLMFLALHEGLDGETLRMLAALATDHTARLTEFPLGWVVGAMTADQAITFATLAGRLVNGSLVISFTDDGRITSTTNS